MSSILSQEWVKREGPNGTWFVGPVLMERRAVGDVSYDHDNSIWVTSEIVAEYLVHLHNARLEEV